MKCNQSCPGFELGLTSSFPTTLTITPRHLHQTQVYVVTQVSVNREMIGRNTLSIKDKGKGLLSNDTR